MKEKTYFKHATLKRNENLKLLLWVNIPVLFLFIFTIFFIKIKFIKQAQLQIPIITLTQDTLSIKPIKNDTLYTVVVPYDVKMKHYFDFIDSIKEAYDTLLPYKLTEHILIRSNPYIIDTLENTDYYHMKARDSFIYDQKQLIILKQGDTLVIPTLEAADTLQAKITRTRLDVNIPEFRLRVIEGNDTLYTFPIRVGQNRTRFLAEVNRAVDLRTRTGKGFIAHIYKKDFFIEPVEGKKFTTTLRDDGRRTQMPLQPWLEPKINGERWGQLIHPTTNPITLGKAYSNGCIGTREADIWRIYYYAPVETRIDIRYNLKINDTTRLKHIYSAKSHISS